MGFFLPLFTLSSASFFFSPSAFVRCLRSHTPQRLTVTELALRPLNVLHSKYLPKERAATHAQVHARNNKLKNRTSRGHAGH